MKQAYWYALDVSLTVTYATFFIRYKHIFQKIKQRVSFFLIYKPDNYKSPIENYKKKMNSIYSATNLSFKLDNESYRVMKFETNFLK